MKSAATICVVLASCLASRSQLLLNQGDFWTYQFSGLPLTGFVPSFGTNPGGSLSIVVNSSSFQAGDALSYQMFENSTAEAPLVSGLMSSAPPFTRLAQQDGAWQDNQGVVRLTMISGSATIDSITLQAIIPGPSLSLYNVFSSTFTPVPEPEPLMMLGGALGLWLMWSLRRSASQ